MEEIILSIETERVIDGDNIITHISSNRDVPLPAGHTLAEVMKSMKQDGWELVLGSMRWQTYTAIAMITFRRSTESV